MDSDFMVDLELEEVTKTITLNCSSFDVFVRELDPSVVMIAL
jgi:hypothetical protein